MPRETSFVGCIMSIVTLVCMLNAHTWYTGLFLSIKTGLCQRQRAYQKENDFENRVRSAFKYFFNGNNKCLGDEASA